MPKQFAGPGIAALVGIGLQLTGWQDAWLGYALLGLAVVWAVALIAGPALVSGIVSEVRRQLSEDETSQMPGELRIAVAQLCDELEYAKSILADREDSYFAEGNSLPMRWYDAHGATLARCGRMEAHRATREAYHRIDEVNRNLDHEEIGYDEWHTSVNPNSADAALAAIDKALEALTASI